MMRIAVWNCNMALERKAGALLDLPRQRSASFGESLRLIVRPTPDVMVCVIAVGRL